MKSKRALVCSSGMTALDIILRLLEKSEEVVAGNDIYGGLGERERESGSHITIGTNRLLTFLTTQNGTRVWHVDTSSLSSIQSCLNAKTRLVLLETPTNPMIKIVDIPSICAMVHDVCPK